MNFSETYRRMNEPIGPSPELIRRPPPKRRLPLRRLAAAAAAAALVLATPALAVRSELGYQVLYRIAPSVAQFFQPVQRSCTDQGVTMEVVGVRVEGDTAQAYITLSGGDVDGTTDLFDSWSFHLPFDQIGRCERVGWDEETRTVTFLCTTQTMDGSPIPQGGKMTFSVRQLLTGKETLKDVAVDLDLASFSEEAETAPSWNLPEEKTPDAFYRSGGAYRDEQGEALNRSAPILRPGPALAEPAPGITITAAGYVVGLFHLQVCWGDLSQLDNHGRLWLEDAAGNQPRQLCSIGFLSDPDLAERKDYTEDLFDIPPEELGQYTLHGDFYTASSRTDGLWRVTFPLETT